MSTVQNQKPPWTQIQWFYPPSKNHCDSLCANIQTGVWKEDPHETILTLKESIQQYDKTELWDLAKRITNPYELIHTHSNRLQLPKSTCCITPLSRSFFKMIEILSHFDFFTRHKQPKLKSLHICEGPGGFIEAFHSIAEKNKRTVQHSFAMTLKSTHVMIPGWRRATQFLQKHPQIELLYGPTKTGNIYEPCNQDACVEVIGPGGAHFVTSDGGFDFSDDFQAQEKNMIRLLVCSALILLRSVAVEGDMVLKVFDCNSQVMRDFITILASCFQSWSLYKPVTSRPCNSEWYFLGKSAYRNKQVAISILTELRDKLQEHEQCEFTQLLETNPLNETIQSLQTNRCDLQMKALNEVLSFCKNYKSMNQEEMWNQQREPSIWWCSAFKMPTEFRSKRY
jgi:23S rRNA U2552 (ribose-2'-O)-methylase RlmE/FtsJ